MKAQHGEISSHGRRPSPGQSFEITYAGETQQIIVGDFSDTLELITDGTWDAGEPLTVRVTDESLNLDTEADEAITMDSDNIPVVILGDAHHAG